MEATKLITTAVCCGLLVLSGSALATDYDFSANAGVDRFAYSNSVPDAVIPPAGNDIPSVPLLASAYAAIAQSDDVRYNTGVVEGGSVAAMRFVFTIAEPGNTVTRIDVLWEGGANEDKPQTVWLWNAVSGSYVPVGSQGAKPPPDGTVTGTFTGNASDFVDAGNNVTVLVNYAENGGALLTDYVRVTITGAQCTVDADCDDGQYCNGAETCTGGVCLPATLINCDDGNACTSDGCNEGTDSCDYLVIDCDDGLACNGTESCDPASGCQTGTPVLCDDGVACTVDLCNEDTDSCDYVPDHAACSNGRFCDGAEVCDPASGCQPGTSVDCDDGIACTADFCNEDADACDNIPDDPACIASVVWYVDDNATGADDGTSWLDAFNSLQDARQAARYGDQIWVAGGIYEPDQGQGQSLGDIAATFQLRNGVVIYGHFLGNETTLAERDLTDLSDPLRQTVLSGDLGVVGNAWDNSNNVVRGAAVDDTTVLDGFTIQDGWARWGGGVALGGGMHIDTGSPTISNCTFTANKALWGGGGVANYNGNPTLINCTFTDNSAEFGGGMSNQYGSPVLVDCSFTANRVDEKGGGMAELFGTSKLTNCTFVGNFTAGEVGMGGGMYVHSFGALYGSTTLTNCLFDGNSAINGGAMLNFGDATLNNCTFSGNSATYYVGGFYSPSQAAELANCILWGNTSNNGLNTDESAQLYLVSSTVNYTCVQGWSGVYQGTGNTGADPLFAGPGAGDYRLSPGSACIDAGDNAVGSPDSLTDLDSSPRYMDDPATVDTGNGQPPIVDMGAYEFPGIVAPCAPLPVPDSPDPADGAIEVNIEPTLAWDGGPPSAPTCPKTFDVYLDASDPPAVLATVGLVEPAFSPLPLADATTYFWQVVTRDCCTETTGPVWSFTTVGTPQLSATPASFDFALPAGQADTAQLTLTNNGNAPTAWTAVELKGTAAARTTAPSAGTAKAPLRGVATDWTAPHEPSTLLVAFRPTPSSKRRTATGRGQAGGQSRLPSAAARGRTHAACGTTKLYSCKTIPVDVVQAPAGADLQAIAAEYAARPEVAYVEPNYIVDAFVTPDDPDFSALWGLHNTGQTGGTSGADIDAPQAWNITTGSRDIIVAVIDTGVDYTHPELAANMWTNDVELNGTTGVDDDGNGIIDDIYGARWTSGNGLPTSGNPYDNHYHGTHVAGTIGAVGDNGVGVVGVNWNVRIMALKFLNPSGATADAISAIEYAVDQGAHLSNNSWGGGGFSQALKDAIEAAGAAGQLFVAAAGNSSRNTDIIPAYPASYDSPTILSVAATDHNDQRADFGWWGSNWGPTTVDLAAPGVSILSTVPGNSYAYLSGTSMAAPHVSGVAALVLAQNPSLLASDLKQVIMDNVDPIPAMAGMTVTGGRLNAANALSADMPWLQIVPATGILNSGESVIIAVAADAAGLADGFVDSGLIRIVSGDPTGPLDIPVSLAVMSCLVDADCDDALYCNGVETCDVSGTCQPGTPVDCSDGIACTIDACNEATGTCDHVASDAACDNGLFCDGIETCDAALDCQPGTPVDCSDGIGCTIDSCNEATGTCDNLPDDGACDNGLFCDGVETCDAVLDCQGGLPVDCDDGVVCTVDSCSEASASCDHVPDGATCDNGVFCDGVETCDAVLGCQGGADPCPGQMCDEAGATCVGCLSDADCNDDVFCNGTELCNAAGVCEPGTSVDCSDGVGCTVDLCNEATGSCDNLPDDGACDNGLFCDGVETCDAVLGCQGGTPPDCSALTDQCNVGVCDYAAGACVGEPMPDGTACDNGDACGGDACLAGVCVPADCGPPPPAPPSALKGGFDEKVELEWKPNNEPDIAGYNVYRSTVSGGPYTQIAGLVNKTAYKDLPPAGSYCYVVTASNTGGGESDYSNEVCGVVGGG